MSLKHDPMERDKCVPDTIQQEVLKESNTLSLPNLLYILGGFVISR